MITIRNKRVDSNRVAAVRVRHQSIRARTFLQPVPKHDGEIAQEAGHVGEVMHIEATGLIFIDVLYQNSGADCASLPEHDHCTTEDHVHDGSGGTVRMEACCVIPEKYPVSIFIDTPVGDPLAAPLGDNLIVSVRRAEGRLEHQYDVGPERGF